MPEKPRVFRPGGGRPVQVARPPRLSAHKRGYTTAWQKASRAYLREHPFCVYCEREGRPLVPAECVDHIVAHKGDDVLFWSESNWAASCIPCNSRKAAREEGALGNPVRRREPPDADGR